MERHACLLFAASAALATDAHLPPGLPAPPVRHLIEVNAQWPLMAPDILDEPRTIRFSAEAERIAEHLHRVRERLVAQVPTGLTSAAAAQRRSLLDTLQAYADRRIFPINTAIPGRAPVFIDERGSACAVGYLMIASGHSELAEDIHYRTNLAYMHDLRRSDMDRWASTHGFTEDELAWIQPTYDFRRSPLPPMVASLALGNGDLLVIQGPVRVEGTPQLRVLRRNGSGEVQLGMLPWLADASAIEFGGHLYIGGTPATTDETPDLYEWDGTTWTSRVTFAGPPGQRGVYALASHSGTLSAFGMPGADGRSARALISTDTSWRSDMR